MNTILSYVWWDYFSSDLILIGSIDAFIVALLVSIIIIFFVNMIKEKSIANKLLNQEVNTLKGFIPICSHCKNIRDAKGYWKKVEHYIEKYSEISFTHGICPGCLNEFYPEFATRNK